MSNPSNAPAGWYPVDPSGTQLRYWDGTNWTDHVRNDVAGAFAQANAQPQSYANAYGGPSGAPAFSVPVLTAPEGTKPNTVWAWLLAFSPALGLINLAIAPSLLSSYSSAMNRMLQDPSDPTASLAIYSSPGYLLSVLSGLVIYAVFIVLAALDYYALRKRGVPRPFHWAWAFLNVLVYVIGRAVVVRRRTGSGLAPLWVFIITLVVVWILGAVVDAVLFSTYFSQLSSQLSSLNT